MLTISTTVAVADDEIELRAIHAQGSGGQNVNKVATAIHLRFDIRNSSLPELYKERLLALDDQRISKEGIIVIKAQRFRSQEKNRDDALARLAELIRSVGRTPKRRVATRPSRAVKERRLDSKKRQGDKKAARTKVDGWH